MKIRILGTVVATDADDDADGSVNELRFLMMLTEVITKMILKHTM